MNDLGFLKVNLGQENQEKPRFNLGLYRLELDLRDLAYATDFKTATA